MVQFLSIASDHLRAEISPYGAALARVWRRGHPTSLVLGLPHPKDYVHAPAAMGVIIAPIAGRISGAKTRLNGVEVQMEANTPPDCLHSGSGGGQNQLWEVTQHTGTSLTLTLSMPDGACGLPGNRVFAATYSISGSELSLTIETTTDADTLVNATSHAYWVLDDSATLDHHRLWVATARMAQTSDALIPTGKVVDHSGGAFDFTSPACPVAGPPLDGCFCLSDAPTENPRKIMSLMSRASGVTLAVHSNNPGLVLYTGAALPRRDAPPGCPAIAPFSAIAIEAQGWPDSPNHLNFPQIVLKAGTKTLQSTIFSVDRS